MALLFLSTPERGAIWRRVFHEAGEEIVMGEAAVTDPAAITEILCWVPPADLGLYPNLRAVISAGAGVDQMPPMPQGVTLVRAEAEGIEEMVRDWVVMAALSLHRDMPAYLAQAARGEWRTQEVRPASSRTIGIMGMGRIGRLAAGALSDLGFPVMGWSRSGAPVEGVRMFGGRDALPAFLSRIDLLVCLLPLTPETRGLMGRLFFSHMRHGALLVQAGRGAQLQLDALREALDLGRIEAAMLDVTDPEPLPRDHWLWSDPRVIVTPHVGANTDAEAGARHALEVVRALREGAPIPGAVDPERGY